MAHYQTKIKGNFHHFAIYLEKAVMSKSATASLEEKMQTCIDGVECRVLVFERYSFTGKNRVSMSVTLLGKENEIEVLASTSGGSTGMFLKINTWGEDDFLSTLYSAVNEYKKNYL